MEIEWTDEDPGTGEKRFVRAGRFARKWSFKARFRRRTSWELVEQPSRDMWETLLDALERRYPRREGVTDEDLKQVRAIVAALPPDEDGDESDAPPHKAAAPERRRD